MSGMRRSCWYSQSIHLTLYYRCPTGYRIGKLEPHHAKLVASKWTVSQSLTKTMWIEGRIRNFLSAAVFPDEDPSQPVAWILQYPSRMIGNLYTMETHRRKGLGLAVMASLCRAIIEDTPDIPLCCTIDEKGSPSTDLVKKLGFVRSPFPFLRHYFIIETNA